MVLPEVFSCMVAICLSIQLSSIFNMCSFDFSGFFCLLALVFLFYNLLLKMISKWCKPTCLKRISGISFCRLFKFLHRMWALESHSYRAALAPVSYLPHAFHSTTFPIIMNIVSTIIIFCIWLHLCILHQPLIHCQDIQSSHWCTVFMYIFMYIFHLLPLVLSVVHAFLSLCSNLY